MSGSIFGTNTASTFATTPLTDDEKVDIRRFCGYPIYGPAAESFTGWRYFQSSGLLEYRMLNMTGGEAQRVRKFLAMCYPLEDAIAGASDNLDTLEASVLKLDPNEVDRRVGLLNHFRRQLCTFMAVPPAGDLESMGGRRIV